MTRKELILRMIQKLPEDVSYARVMYHLTVMEKIERGDEQIERGEGIDHDDLVAQLEEEECRASESSGPPKRKRTSKASAATSPGTTHGRRPRSKTGS